MTDVEELDRKIKEGEILLAQERTSGWMLLIGSVVIVFFLGMKISQSEIYLFLTVLALLYLGFNIWRVINAQRNVKNLKQRYRNIGTRRPNLKRLFPDL